MMKRTIAMLLLLMLTCVGQACSKEPLKIALVTWVGYGPFYIAQEKGIFEKNGIDVELLRIEGDIERRTAIASGQIDAIAMTLDAMIVLRSNGIPVKAVMAIDASVGGDGIVATKDIQTVSDLKGKTVAFPTGLPSHYFLYSVLKDAGLKVSDVRSIVMDADKAGSAFYAGKVNAAVTWEPWLTKASQTKNGHILIDTSAKPTEIIDVLYVREAVIEKRNGELSALVKSWMEAVEFFKANPEESKEIIAKAFKLPKDDLEMLLPKVRYADSEENVKAFGTEKAPGYLYELYGKVSEAWLAEKVIRKADEAEKGIYPDFIRKPE